MEGKEDIFEDWREKFFNTWRVRERAKRERVTFSLLTSRCSSVRLTYFARAPLLLCGRSEEDLIPVLKVVDQAGCGFILMWKCLSRFILRWFQVVFHHFN